MTAEQLEKLTRGLPSKSAKIRRLADAGVARADIARFLKIKYQFVRNVLVARKDETEAAGERDALGPEDQTSPLRLRVGSGGAIVLPESLRRALRVVDGDSLIALVGDGEVALMSVPTAIRKVQAMVRKHVPAGVSLVDELLNERKEEVRRAWKVG